MRVMSALLLITATVVSVASAQTPDAPKRPPEWQVRYDQADADTSALFFVEMKPGWHITTGPAVILYDPSRTASGNYRLETEIFFFRDKSGDREGYGILLGGARLDGPDQNYLYFLLRNDGRFLVKHRAGTETHLIQDWTENSAILRHTGDGATVKNSIAVEAGPQQVRLLINGIEVGTYPRDHMKAEGIVGLRANHGLNLHVTKLEILPSR
jgi:hypothetical protein